MHLPESGIRYPEGFDPNTVGEVTGKARGLLQPEKGPVRFQVDTGRGTYTVLASPGWYWDDVKPRVAEGTDIRVRGSKTLGRDGNLYIIAQEVEVLAAGEKIVLRSEDGRPLWRGPSMGARHGHGGPGSSQGGMGMGGMGGGAGRGRGRR
ncbi:MAG: OB-fold nucleic acid binding domain-containing protein [bacterium]